jgi:hypothetical protein
MVLYGQSKGLPTKAVTDTYPKVQKIRCKNAINIEHGPPVKTEVEGGIPEGILYASNSYHTHGKFFVPFSSKGTSAQVDKDSFITKWFQVVLIKCRKVETMPVVEDICFDGFHFMPPESLVGYAAGESGPDSH